MSDATYIWILNWGEHQSFQKKRGKPWAPPWIKLKTQILDDPDYLDLTPETRSLLVGLWALFGRSRGTVAKDTRRLSAQLHQRVTEPQLNTLNQAGFIEFCSGTDLEQRRDAFWNSSALEENREEEITRAVTSEVDVANGPVLLSTGTDDARPFPIPELRSL